MVVSSSTVFTELFLHSNYKKYSLKFSAGEQKIEGHQLSPCPNVALLLPTQTNSRVFSIQPTVPPSKKVNLLLCHHVKWIKAPESNFWAEQNPFICSFIHILKMFEGPTKCQAFWAGILTFFLYDVFPTLPMTPGMRWSFHKLLLNEHKKVLFEGTNVAGSLALRPKSVPFPVIVCLFVFSSHQLPEQVIHICWINEYINEQRRNDSWCHWCLNDVCDFSPGPRAGPHRQTGDLFAKFPFKGVF